MTNTTFISLLTAWENAAAGSDENEKYNAGQTLATACVYSVLKKLINVSPDRRNIAAMRVDVAKHSRIDAAMEVLNDNTKSAYNENGDYITTTKDTETESAIVKFLHQCDGDGVDLIGDAWIAILEETKKEDHLFGRCIAPRGWMSTPYKLRRLKKKVYTKSGNKSTEWIEEETTHIQQIFKAIRHSIENARAVSSASSKYIYIDREEVNPDTLDYIKVYDRYNSLDIGSETCDCAGVYTADRQTITDTENAIEEMNLTKRQAEVLALSLKGCGLDEIADALKVSRERIKTIKQEIAKKAIAASIGSTDLLTAKSAAVKDAAAVAMYAADNPDVVLCTFESISKAAKITGIDKGNISRVINGKKQTAGGYIFKKIK